jgi:photosystem II stability/assembly factor-like uncharacterized protein
LGLRALLLLAGAAASCASPQEAAAPSLRGLSCGGGAAAWASGSGGTILRTADGVHWERIPPPPGAEQLDFRDLEAVSDECLLMSAGPGAASGLWHTADGGRSWEKRLDCPWPEGFFDGMDFWDAQRGLLVGDPVDGALMILRTEDGGSTWKHLKEEARAHFVPDEFAFAASGSSVCTLGTRRAWIGTGGAGAARVWRSTDAGATWQVTDSPLFRGRASAGIFSIAFADERHGVIVGGDYLEPDARERTAAWTADGGRTWTLATTPPGGYRSAVAPLAGASGALRFVCTGPSGTDVSEDGGRTWQPMRGGDGGLLPGFHAVSAPYLAGSDGRIERLPPQP